MFGSVSLAGLTFTADEVQLSNDMMQYWGNFIKYGNPNGDFTQKAVRNKFMEII